MNKKSLASAPFYFLAILVLACGETTTIASGITKAADKTEAVISTQQMITEEPSATAEPSQTPTLSMGKIGDTIVQGNYIVTLMNVESGQQYDDYYKPEAGNIFVAVEILIESGADQGVSVNPFYCTIKDSDGYEYNMTIFGKEPALTATNDLPKGEKARGWITFEVPEKAKGLTFIYSPLSFTDTIRIKFDLGI